MQFDKKSYKQLKKLSNVFINHQLGGYNIIQGIADWLKQHNIPTTKTHIDIICNIYGKTVPLVYEDDARLEIVAYIQTHNYKGIKNVK